jgi:hypothetical protein
MRRFIVLVLAAFLAVSTSGCFVQVPAGSAATPPKPSPTAAEPETLSYYAGLQVLRKDNPGFMNFDATTIIGLAHGVCDFLDAGADAQAVVDTTVTGGFTQQEAIGLLMFAVYTDCGEHQATLDESWRIDK